MNDSTMRLVTKEEAELILDCGAHPVAHKFLQQQGAAEKTFSLRLGKGKHSGLVGLIEPPEWAELTPIYEWIKCNEPEDHLDDLVEKLIPLMPDSPRILGLSDKDSTTLHRLQNKGFLNTALFHHPLLEGLTKPGVEVVQAAISATDNGACHAPSDSPLYDVIIGRHILEHTWDTQPFLQNLVSMLSDDGVALLEVPDNEKAFKDAQHTIIWEEHSLYFTQATLSGLLQEYGMQVEQIIRYPMALEDILVAVIRKSPELADGAKPLEEDATKEIASLKSVTEQAELVAHFQKRFTPMKQFFHEKLRAYRAQYGDIAILGAGHLGAAFVNYYALGDVIDVVIDDDPNKQGMFMPGSHLPIIDSSKLRDGRYRFCLLTCNPWNNDKIAERNRAFIENGGVFLSIFQPELWS